MQIIEKKSKDIVTYHITGDIDINSSPDIRKSFEKCVNAKAMKVLVNLSGVSYVDSSGLATLVEMLKRTRAYGGKLRLAGLAAKVRSLFEITKLEKLFEIYDSEQDATANF